MSNHDVLSSACRLLQADIFGGHRVELLGGKALDVLDEVVLLSPANDWEERSVLMAAVIKHEPFSSTAFPPVFLNYLAALRVGSTFPFPVVGKYCGRCVISNECRAVTPASGNICFVLHMRDVLQARQSVPSMAYAKFGGGLNRDDIPSWAALLARRVALYRVAARKRQAARSNC
jgi:hypothetical protein